METRRKNVGDEILEVSPVKGYRSWIWIMNYELPCLGMHIWIVYIGGSALPLIFWSILLGSLPHIIGWLKPPIKKKGTMKQNQRRKLWIKMSTIESNSKFFIWNQFGCSWIIEKLQLSTLPKIKKQGWFESLSKSWRWTIRTQKISHDIQKLVEDHLLFSSKLELFPGRIQPMLWVSI